MTRRFSFVPFAFLPCLAAIASCGSSDAPATTTDGSDASVGDGSAAPYDGAADAPISDASVSGCPADEPTDGTPCSPPPLQCEYGNFAFADCNATATCTTQGWSVAPPLIPHCAENNTRCPATAGEIARGQPCTLNGVTCKYREATCACTTRASADAQALWVCDDGPADCPAPRPLLGTPCAEDGKTCDYSSCGVIRNIEQQCRKGTWQFVFPYCDGG